jgi:hypothetical protein
VKQHDQNDYGGGRVRRTTELKNEGDDGFKRDDITRARQQDFNKLVYGKNGSDG